LASVSDIKPPEIAGITYYYPKADFLLEARDGKVKIPLVDLPIPLLKEDLSGTEPTYDAVGRGIYQFLRMSPDARWAQQYAFLLRDAYPHLLAELATNLVMLDNKDVDLPYLDRKIGYLKIFSLLESENHHFPLEIGAAYFEKGLTLAALSNTTLNFFTAEKYLRKALQLKQDDLKARNLLAEVCYLIGKYADAHVLWREVLDNVEADAAVKIRIRLDRIEQARVPQVPAVDYLQAVGVALEAFEVSDFEESAAIILDVIDEVSVFEEFPLAEINYLLGLCYVRLDMPKYAEQYLQEALSLRPEFKEARQQLEDLGVS
jgi:tetratricopeptide (TPR) repeat protein